MPNHLQLTVHVNTRIVHVTQPRTLLKRQKSHRYPTLQARAHTYRYATNRISQTVTMVNLDKKRRTADSGSRPYHKIINIDVDEILCYHVSRQYSLQTNELLHKRQDCTRRDAAEDADWQRLEQRANSKHNKQMDHRGQGTCHLCTTAGSLMNQRARRRLSRHKTAEERASHVVQRTGEQLLVVVHLVAV